MHSPAPAFAGASSLLARRPWRALAVLLPVLAGCGEPAQPPPAQVVRPVKIITFSSEGNSITVEYSGTVGAAQRSDMAFEVPGRITEYLVQAGDAVEEGQLLARLDPADYQAQLDKARADRNASEADFRRFDQAFRENAVTRQDLDRARRNLEVAEASLRTAVKAVSDTELRAPFKGVVAQKLVNDFANVQAKQPVLVLQDDSSLELSVDIPEQDWAHTRPGLDTKERSKRARPRVVVAALPEREFPAYLKELNTTADPVTRTYQVTFGFENPTDVTVRVGMTGRVILTVPPDVSFSSSVGSASIPTAAVRTDDTGEAFVWVIDANMRAARRPVTLGVLAGDHIQIIEGLQAGERIAVSGVHVLREGMTVRAYEP